MGDFIEIIQSYTANGGTKMLIRKNLVLQVWHDIARNVTAMYLANGETVYAEDDYNDVRRMLCGKEEN